MLSFKGAPLKGHCSAARHPKQAIVGTTVQGQLKKSEVVYPARCVPGQRSYFPHHSLIRCLVVCSESTRGAGLSVRVYLQDSVSLFRFHTVPYLTTAKPEEQAAPGESRTQVTPATEECPVTGSTKAGFTSSGLCFVWESWWPAHMVCGLG